MAFDGIQPPTKGFKSFVITREPFDDIITLWVKENSYIMDLEEIRIWFRNLDVDDKILDYAFNFQKLKYYIETKEFELLEGKLRRSDVRGN